MGSQRCRLEGENKKHLHNQSKDECHLIASYQLARYLLLATSYLLLATSYLLLATNYLLLATSYLLLASSL